MSHQVDGERDAAAHVATHKAARPRASSSEPHPDDTPRDAYLRPPNEDDDGYDPYSDRPPAAEPLFERDPWS